MNKILFIQEFGETVPSGIIRGTIYKSEFIKNNKYCYFINRNNENLINLIKKQNNSITIIVLKLLNQIFKYFISVKIIFISIYFDGIWLNKVLSPRFIILLRWFNKTKIINLDVVDNPYENNIKWQNSLKFVTSVSTDNHYNKKKLLKFCQNINIIPDYPLIHKFCAITQKKDLHKFNFGWVGSNSSYYLLQAIESEIIKFLEQNDDAVFYLLGAPNESKFIGIPNVVFIKDYNEKLMIEIINKLHVGLFPLDDSLASEVRGVLKATLYMAGSSVVIANIIGEVNDLIEDNFNGLLVKNKQDWIEKLLYLKNNKNELIRIANNGYTKVVNNYSLETNTNRILEILGCNVLYK